MTAFHPDDEEPNVDMTQKSRTTSRPGSKALCFGRGIALVALCGLLSLNGGCSRATPVLEEIGVIQMPYGVQSVAWHPDGQRVAVGYFLKDEVEVWDAETRRALFKVSSKRHPINESGQEILFSPDGKYLVVQDTEDTRNGDPPFPRTRDDPLEAAAEADKKRLILARVWEVATSKEVAQIHGPASWVHHGPLKGMCWVGGERYRLAVLRGAAVATYDVSTGSATGELSLLYPFEDHPDIHWSYSRMSCHPARPEVALQGGWFQDEKAAAFGFPRDTRASPVVVADLEQRRIRKVLVSQTSLNGVTFTADGKHLASSGEAPIRVWDVDAGYMPAGEVVEPAHPAEQLAAVSGYDGFLGISVDGTVHTLYLWDSARLRPAAGLSVPRDAFRVAVNNQATTVAVAVGSHVHLFRINKAYLNPTKTTGN